MVTPTGIVIGLAEDTPAEAAQFCRLSNSLYARTVGPPYYRWQFFEPPFPTILAVARSAHGLVGTYGLQMRALASGESFAWAIDIMVEPSMQRRGVFKALSAFALERAHAWRPVAAGVMANAKAERAHVEGLGWTRVEVFRTYECDVNVAGKPPSDWVFERCTEVSGHAPLLAPDHAVGNLARGARNPDFLRWRFLANPRYPYELWRASVAGSPFGYLALKVFRDPTSGHAFGDIVDIQWVEPDPEGLSWMLRFALRRFREAGVSRAATWLQTNTILDGAGRALGFSPTGHPRYFCLRTLQPGQGGLCHPGSWSLTMADAEVY